MRAGVIYTKKELSNSSRMYTELIQLGHSDDFYAPSNYQK